MWLDTVFVPKKTASGSVSGIVIIQHDVTAKTEKLKTENAEAERLSWVIDGTGAGTWEWNLVTGERKINERWAQMLGYTLEELDRPSKPFRRFPLIRMTTSGLRKC